MRHAPMPAMRLLLDDNLPVEVGDDLRAAGVAVRTLADLAGAQHPPDTLLMRAVHRERLPLLSLDEGIADARRFPPEQYAGLVLLRPPSAGRTALRAFVARHLPALLRLPLSGQLITVGADGLRLEAPLP